MKLNLIFPRKLFNSNEEIIQCASGDKADVARFELMDVVLVAVIVDKDGIPIEIPNMFLAYVALRSNSATGDTTRSYAESILSWLRYIEKRNLKLENATEENILTYRNFLVNQATKGGQRKNTSSTVNLRLAAVEGMYQWAHRRSVMKTELGEWLCTRALGRGKRTWSGPGNARRGEQSHRVGIIQRLPRVLSEKEITMFFSIVPISYKLMFRWSIATGMRRFEVCNLKKSAISNTEGYLNRGEQLIPVEMIRKGGRMQTVYAPAALIEETIWYCAMERTKEQEEKYGDYVFINRKGRNFSRERLSRLFRKYADQIGVDATLHHMRHTFAISVLGMLEHKESRGESINSIKTVQILLGHANVTTTETYLRALDIASDDVRESLGFLYGATL